MKAWLLKDFGLNNLVMGEVEAPVPNAGELLVKVLAVSLNFRDKAIADGIYQPHMVPKPLIPVSDAVGVVVKVGDGVAKFKVGDRVNSHLYSHWQDGVPSLDEQEYCVGMPLPGGLAEYMIINENGAVHAPASMSNEEASTLPIAALTAWHALMDVGNLQPGQTVLVQGTGGVSVFAAQIASAHGARVIVISSSDDKLERVKAFGCSHGVNYRTYPNWEEKVLELTAGKGVDITLDIAGGDGLNKSVLATKMAGVVVQVGFLGGQKAVLVLMPVIFRRTRIQGVAVAPRSSFERMNSFLDRHRIKPVIDRIYAFEEARQAYEHMGRGPFGKVVIKVGD